MIQRASSSRGNDEFASKKAKNPQIYNVEERLANFWRACGLNVG